MPRQFVGASLFLGWYLYVMPSSRAVLADIKRLGLDPTKAYSVIGGHGHIKNVIRRSGPSGETPIVEQPAVVEQIVQQEAVVEIQPLVEQPIIDQVDNESTPVSTGENVAVDESGSQSMSHEPFSSSESSTKKKKKSAIS
jgi:hypothetical protein